MRDKLTTPLVRVAERQGGAISLAQLESAGLDRAAVGRWVQAGRLHHRYRGVYLLGHRAITQRGEWWAAVLAGGEGTVLSHFAAAALWGIRDRPRAVTDVISPRRIRQQGIRAHRSPLHPADVTTHQGLPTTTPERTLIDEADLLTPRQLERDYDHARVHNLLTLNALDQALQRADGRRGAAALRTIIAADRAPAATASELERAFIALIDAAGLPRPASNRVLNGHRVDFHWPHHRLIVETDGHAAHVTRRQRQLDARRDVTAVRHGWRVLRFTYEDVTTDPAYVIEALTELLTASSRAATSPAPGTSERTTAAASSRQSARFTSG
jgi:very-short-patch-repair endonuclease